MGQPLTVTDNLGHVTHMRYDAQGRVTSATDALSNETDASYNLVGQLDTVTLPATGQTGTGHGRTVNAYLYVGGQPRRAPSTTRATYKCGRSRVLTGQRANRRPCQAALSQ
ncbi:MAG: RHS repeat domain-containing protein [Pyrinomonadaceae bacterium]